MLFPTTTLTAQLLCTTSEQCSRQGARRRSPSSVRRPPCAKQIHGRTEEEYPLHLAQHAACTSPMRQARSGATARASAFTVAWNARSVGFLRNGKAGLTARWSRCVDVKRVSKRIAIPMFLAQPSSFPATRHKGSCREVARSPACR